MKVRRRSRRSSSRDKCWADRGEDLPHQHARPLRALRCRGLDVLSARAGAGDGVFEDCSPKVRQIVQGLHLEADLARHRAVESESMRRPRLRTLDFELPSPRSPHGVDLASPQHRRRAALTARLKSSSPPGRAHQPDPGQPPHRMQDLGRVRWKADAICAGTTARTVRAQSSARFCAIPGRRGEIFRGRICMWAGNRTQFFLTRWEDRAAGPEVTTSPKSARLVDADESHRSL